MDSRCTGLKLLEGRAAWLIKRGGEHYPCENVERYPSGASKAIPRGDERDEREDWRQGPGRKGDME